MTDLLERLRRLGLRLSAEALRNLLAQAQAGGSSPEAVLDQLVELEQREREARNLARRTKAATLGTFKTLERFDWNHPRKVDRALYEELLRLRFLAEGDNVLLRGPAGVGKTTLAQNLGLRALEQGHTVRFCTLHTALNDLLRQESLPALERRLKRYTGPDLLLVDELGYVPCDSRAADLLFHVISRRHERRSVVITTNLPFKQWGAVFQEASCLGALVDRFAQHCHVLDIEAESYRRRSSVRRDPARGSAQRRA
jgi:DNA replication protein DnaC